MPAAPNPKMNSTHPNKKPTKVQAQRDTHSPIWLSQLQTTQVLVGNHSNIAKGIGLTVRPASLARANEVIE
jgi:hypothetical protein